MDSVQKGSLPKVDLILATPTLQDAHLSPGLLRKAAKIELETFGSDGGPIPTVNQLAYAVLRRALSMLEPGLTAVVNATGMVFHTYFGRAPLAETAVQAMNRAAGYCAVDYDLGTGRQGDRASRVEALLCDLTGAEGAIVVNNNAAAVVLALTALAFGKGVALSRGELLEYDGFRIPDILEQSGAGLIEVGATNCTRQADYRAAVETGKVSLLFKIHASNFRQIGATQETSLSELVGLGRAYGLPVFYDLGAGLLLSANRLGLPEEIPSVSNSIHAGADLVCFSGDKLLGGPQAGILVGRKWAIDAIRFHPILRAMLLDKTRLAALEATLRLYRNLDTARKEIPVLRMLTADRNDLLPAAARLAADLGHACGKKCTVAVEDGWSETGALPGKSFPTAFVTLKPHETTPETFQTALRSAETPVISLVQNGKVVLDMRTVRPEETSILYEAIRAAMQATK